MKNVIPALVLSILFFSCKKSDSSSSGPTAPPTVPTVTLPSLTTTAIATITIATATGGGNISSDGGGTVTARGVCWGTTTGPVATGNHTSDGSGTGSFTSSITGLTSGTTYYVRAYAANSAGTAYGNEVSFTTLTPIVNNVYVVGSESNGTYNVAKIWKNGTATSLTDGTQIGRAHV